MLHKAGDCEEKGGVFWGEPWYPFSSFIPNPSIFGGLQLPTHVAAKASVGSELIWVWVKIIATGIGPQV